MSELNKFPMIRYMQTRFMCYCIVWEYHYYVHIFPPLFITMVLSIFPLACILLFIVILSIIIGAVTLQRYHRRTEAQRAVRPRLSRADRRNITAEFSRLRFELFEELRVILPELVKRIGPFTIQTLDIALRDTEAGADTPAVVRKVREEIAAVDRKFQKLHQACAASMLQTYTTTYRQRSVVRMLEKVVERTEKIAKSYRSGLAYR